VVEHGRYRRVMLFVVVAIVLVGAVLGVWANARSRRQLEALNEKPDDMKRAGDSDQPPSSSGYLGPLD
jgi:hypothetical protein